MNLRNGIFRKREVSVWLALIPLAVLVAMLALVIKVFGSDAIEGGSQIALLVASSVAALIAVVVCRCKWNTLETAIVENIRTSASAIIILLLIGAIAGTWMKSGVVPTLMYYGLQITIFYHYLKILVAFFYDFYKIFLEICQVFFS